MLTKVILPIWLEDEVAADNPHILAPMVVFIGVIEIAVTSGS